MFYTEIHGKIFNNWIIFAGWLEDVYHGGIMRLFRRHINIKIISTSEEKTITLNFSKKDNSEYPFLWGVHVSWSTGEKIAQIVKNGVCRDSNTLLPAWLKLNRSENNKLHPGHVLPLTTWYPWGHIHENFPGSLTHWYWHK